VLPPLPPLPPAVAARRGVVTVHSQFRKPEHRAGERAANLGSWHEPAS